jgi:hypothetical protein
VGTEQGDADLAVDDVLPLVGRRVPMELAQDSMVRKACLFGLFKRPRLPDADELHDA